MCSNHRPSAVPSNVRKPVFAVHQVLHPYRDRHARAENLAQREGGKEETVFSKSGINSTGKVSFKPFHFRRRWHLSSRLLFK